MKPKVGICALVGRCAPGPAGHSQWLPPIEAVKVRNPIPFRDGIRQP